MKKCVSLLIYVLLLFSCGTKKQDEALANVIQKDFVFTDTLLTYEFIDTTGLRISFNKKPQFEKYLVGLWVWRWSDNKDISTHDEYESYTNAYKVENNEIILHNMNLKGNHPDSLRITLDLQPLGVEFIQDEYANKFGRYTPDSLPGVLNPPPYFSEKATKINYTYLYNIEDKEILEFCKKEVRMAFKKVNGR